MAPLRTRIYIDGFNFYYGLLKGSRYKWLDLLALFERQILPSILHRIEPDREPLDMVLDDRAVKFFTATILESLASGADSVSSQAIYHNALLKNASGRVELVLGGYSVHQATQHVVPVDDPHRQPKFCPRQLVWKVEEKQTDVNMALHAYDDALSGEIDQVVIVTNDTDLTLALEMIRKRCPNVVVGLVIPAKPSPLFGGRARKANAALCQHAHWVRDHITEAELAASQLPTVVQGGRRGAVKLDSWYARPDLFALMIEKAKPVLKERSRIMKWANSPSPRLGNQKPIDLIETDAGADLVFTYIADYISATKAAATDNGHALAAEVVDDGY